MVDEWGPGGLENLSWFYTHEKIPILLVWVPEVLLPQSPGARTLTTQAIGGQIFCKLHLPTMIATPQKDTKKCFQEGSSMIFKSLRSDKMMIHIYIYIIIYTYSFISEFPVFNVLSMWRLLYIRHTLPKFKIDPFQTSFTSGKIILQSLIWKGLIS